MEGVLEPALAESEICDRGICTRTLQGENLRSSFKPEGPALVLLDVLLEGVAFICC